MTDAQFIFMLPSLYEKGLLSDDRNEYALVTYPRAVISDASRIIVKDYASRIDTLDLSRKKRVKCVSENLAVALSLPIKDVDSMSTARTIYKNWASGDLSIFGAVPRQNKFLRRIIKHLSLPFALREPDDEEIFKGNFHVLLNNIISDYRDLATKVGNIFEKETWLTLLYTTIGVSDALLSFPLTEKLPKSDAAKLRQKSVDTCLTVIMNSGIDDVDVWKKLREYCFKWSNSNDFVKVWGHAIEMLFVYMNIRIYNQEVSANVFTEGVYSEKNTISEKMIKFIFFNFLNMVDIQKMRESVPILKEFAMTLSRLTLKAELVPNTADTLLSNKYPSNSFLKLFGPYLTFVPQIDEAFDEAIAINIDSILSIISNFDIDYQGETVKRLISYCAKRAVPSHMAIVAAFLKRSSQLFRHNTLVLPFVSELVLQLIPQLDTSKSPRLLIGDQFLSSVCSTFISATEVMRNDTSLTKQINDSFEMIWKTTAYFPIRFQLLCFAHSTEIPIQEKLAFIFNEGNFRQMASDSTNVSFLASCILFVGVWVRFKPEVSSTITELKIIPSILNSVMQTSPHRLEEYNLLVIAIEQMLINCIEYGQRLFDDRDVVNSVCDFIAYIFEQTQSIAPQHSGREKSKHSQSSSTPAIWLEKFGDIIYALNCRLSLMVATHFPSKDHFSRRLNSSFEVNEECIIEKYQIKNPKVNYFSIGDSALVSFIEGADGSDPLVLLVRGAGGKSIFVVKDDFADENYEQKADNNSVYNSDIKDNSNSAGNSADISRNNSGNFSRNNSSNFSRNNSSSGINNNYGGGNSGLQPKLSTEISNVPLPSADEAARTSPPSNEWFAGKFINSVMSYDVLKGIDNGTTSSFQADFSTWLDWRVFGFFGGFFNEKSAYRRARVADFLATTGLLSGRNASHIRIYNSSSSSNQTASNNTTGALKLAIQNLDVNDFNSLLPVVVYHVLSCDTATRQGELPAYDVTKTHSRMTPRLQEFLRSIGEPMEVPSQLNILPPLRSTVPVIPSVQALIAFFTPAMAASEDGARTIFKMGETTAMKIIFNETSFDIKMPAEKKPKQHVLCISPTAGDGLYHVTQLHVPKGVFSPFTEEQTMTAENIAFNIAMSYEQTIRSNTTLIPAISERRREIIKSLFTESVDESLPGKIAVQF